MSVKVHLRPFAASHNSRYYASLRDSANHFIRVDFNLAFNGGCDIVIGHGIFGMVAFNQGKQE